MSEYIKREDVIEITAETGALETQNRVRDLPTADVVEVRHGHWEISRPRYLRLDRRDSWFKCSECGAHRIRRTGETLNYCPNCGARMDGKRKGEEE